MSSSQQDFVKPLMPKATAVWLIHNTKLTFRQIADSCGLHILEVENLDEQNLRGENPIYNGQLTWEEIERCHADENARLTFQDPAAAFLKNKKSRKYTPLAVRQDRPDAIAWLLRNHPELSDNQICKLISTTSKTIQAIRNKTHARHAQIKPTNPVILGLCSEEQLSALLQSASSNRPTS
jgi:hypothetical protein